VTTRSLAVRLAAAAIAWDTDPTSDLRRVAELADTPGLAATATTHVGNNLRPVIATLPPRTLEQAQAALSTGGSASAARIKLVVVAVAGRYAS
jgi:hypothetical protein